MSGSAITVDGLDAETELARLRDALVKLDPRLASIEVDGDTWEVPVLVLSQADSWILVEKLRAIRLALDDTREMVRLSLVDAP